MRSDCETNREHRASRPTCRDGFDGFVGGSVGASTAR